MKFFSVLKDVSEYQRWLEFYLEKNPTKVGTLNTRSESLHDFSWRAAASGEVFQTTQAISYNSRRAKSLRR
jgi:hypothetical protein